MKAFRGAVYAAGFGLIVYGLALAFFVSWFGIAIAAGAALIAAAGLAEYVMRHGHDEADDCGFRGTIFGQPQAPPYLSPTTEPAPLATSRTYSPAAALTVIEGGKRPVWPNTAGAPE